MLLYCGRNKEYLLEGTILEMVKINMKIND
jgi:hypothetical protein